ncbi:MAG: carboxypeptidase regulatory-like domain-containing protein [Acidobacteriota bacterium]
MHRLLLGLGLFIPAFAQTSSLSGVVRDHQSGVVANAVVALTNNDTAAPRKTLTTATGDFVFPSLPPGNYTLETQMPGFRTASQQIRLQVNVPLSVAVQLEVGQVTETINVVGESPTVNTQNATIGNAFTETQVRQLPLLTRNVVELLSLQPGVTSTGEVIGARRDQNNITLDGVDVNDNQSAGTTSADRGFFAALPVPLDSVQEFRVTIAGQGADQGRSSGGQVSLVTKSGSNQWHGSLYEFHRNKSTAANDWFSNRSGLKRENLIRNQFGASFGGRIVKDRAFFFLNWEERKDRSASAVLRTVPTDSLKAGIVTFRTNSGGIQTLTPAEARQVDPLGVGISSAMLSLLKSYPAPNDPSAGGDRGLNFGGYRFNAPLTRNDRAYVAKMDFHLDREARHTLMLRGTLGDNSRDQVLAQFPGQDPAARTLDNSKGLSARYTAVLSPSLVNVFTFGYTRLGIAQSGNGNPALAFGGISSVENFTRGFGRFIPTANFVNDQTWTKNKHTLQYGVNFRFIQNDRNSFATSFPSYSFSRNTLRGLGADLQDSVNSYIRQRSGNSALAVSEALQVVNAYGTLFGVINQYSGTYNFGIDGQAVPLGQSIDRGFRTRELDFYIQDTYKVRRDLTLTYGLRYSLFTPPFEVNGVQVVPTVPLQNLFADRVGASALGIPGHLLPTARVTYAPGGPVNKGAGWFGYDTNNFAPRLNVAWAPEFNGAAGRLFGKGSVIRFGASMLYDRYGSDMIVNFDQSGSPGLASQVTQPRNTNFSDSFRYSGGGLPALPPPPAAGLPFTPPTIVGGFGSFTGVASNLVAPYSILLNMTYARNLPGKMMFEVGYVGRLSRKGLVQQDFFQPLTEFRDPRSGATWAEASGILRDRFEAGLTPAQVRANPALLPPVPFFENMFPGAANRTFPGSATANYYFTNYSTYAGSDLDTLNDMDRERLPNGSCISVFGCNTFFALQNAGLRAWVNAANANFHGGQLVFRRPVTDGWGFDFNYTLSHSLDIVSAAESGAGNGGAVIQNSFNPKASYASSDFDIRHNITANTVVELPFGKGKPFLHSAPGWANHLLAGWQITALTRYRSGLPFNISTGGIYPTNYLSSSTAILRPGAAFPASGPGFDQNGNPSIFRNTNAVQAFIGQYPGRVGTRNLLRGAPLFNTDMSLGKYFPLPWEGHRIQVRAEAFNAFNNVNWGEPTRTLANPGNFGQITATSVAARVLQFALRYEF